ncbi:MAG: hypothetical protein WBM24_17395 [Candidatus Sulfotelmatobacter sp.]
MSNAYDPRFAILRRFKRKEISAEEAEALATKTGHDLHESYIRERTGPRIKKFAAKHIPGLEFMWFAEIAQDYTERRSQQRCDLQESLGQFWSRLEQSIFDGEFENHRVRWGRFKNDGKCHNVRIRCLTGEECFRISRDSYVRWFLVNGHQAMIDSMLYYSLVPADVGIEWCASHSIDLPIRWKRNQENGGGQKQNEFLTLGCNEQKHQAVDDAIATLRLSVLQAMTQKKREKELVDWVCHNRAPVTVSNRFARTKFAKAKKRNECS